MRLKVKCQFINYIIISSAWYGTNNGNNDANDANEAMTVTNWKNEILQFHTNLHLHGPVKSAEKVMCKMLINSIGRNGPSDLVVNYKPQAPQKLV